MSNPRSRKCQLERINGGSFDVIIIGSGVCEAAIFATLASKGIPVALISPLDFTSRSNQDIPFLLNDGYESVRGSALTNSYVTNKSIQKMYASKTTGIEKIPYLSLILEAKQENVGSSTRRVLANSIVSKSGKPQLIRQKRLNVLHDKMRVSNLKGAIEHSATYCPDGEGRLAMNLIHHGMSHNTNNALAVNYLEPVLANQTRGKPWEVVFRDTIGNKEITLSSKVVIESQRPDAENIVPLVSETKQVAIHNTHISVPKFISKQQYIRLFNNKNRRMTISPALDKNIVTCSRIKNEDESEEPFTEDIKNILSAINAQYKLVKGIREQDITSVWTTTSQQLSTNSQDNLCNLSFIGIKNQVKVDAAKRVINLRGARVSSSYYISTEIEKIVSRIGIEYKSDTNKWHNSSDKTEKSYFLDLAKNLEMLDSDGNVNSHALSIWRRHKSNSFKILDIIESNEKLAKPIIGGYNYLWAEIAAIRSHEMVTSLEDFLYRRTILGQLNGESVFKYISKDKLQKALWLEDLAPTPSTEHEIKST